MGSKARQPGEVVSTPGAVEIGIDIGGTFTDVVCRCAGRADADRQDPDDARRPERRPCCTRSR